MQYKDGASGTWTDWITSTTALSSTFTGGQDGHTYFFQSRARDTAGNVEAYPGGDGDARTTVDLTGPTISSNPDMRLFVAGASTGAAATFSAPVATDNLDVNVDVVCTPPSGSIFPTGTTRVACTATDDVGNPASSYFDVVVEVLALFLHGSGANANPPVVYLDRASPTATTAKYKDSTSLNYSGGNP